MQRMTRRIFAELSRRAAVTPICWNKIGRFYQRLGSTEHKLLTRPFDVRSRPTTRPERRGQNPIAELRRFVLLPRFDFINLLSEEDVFISPDTHHDSRRKYLPSLIGRTRVRSVAIFHDAARVRLASVYRSRGRHQREYIASLAAFDLVICVSLEAQEDLRDLWNQFGCKAAPTSLEPWPAELERAASGPASGARSNRVIYVSSLDPRKNHLTLFSAAEKLWAEGLDFELHLIGRATNIGGREVPSAVRKFRRAGRPIEWLRHVDDKTLLREYDDCRFTVYPSLMEGYGLPIVESLVHGKPCICGANGALGEVARGGGCLIVDQTSAAALAEGIKMLLIDQQLYSRLSNEARARKFRSWSDYIDKFLTHLELTRAADVARVPISH